MRKVTPCLWFDHQAEAAMAFYQSVFASFRLLETMRYGEAGPGAPGTVMAVRFEIGGQELTVINGGPVYRLSPAISFFIPCDTQDEIDRLWSALGEGGELSRCGWLTDRFGVTWQIIPAVLHELLQDKDPARAARVSRAMLQMVKLDIAALQAAADGAEA